MAPQPAHSYRQNWNAKIDTGIMQRHPIHQCIVAIRWVRGEQARVQREYWGVNNVHRQLQSLYLDSSPCERFFSRTRRHEKKIADLGPDVTKKNRGCQNQHFSRFWNTCKFTKDFDIFRKFPTSRKKIADFGSDVTKKKSPMLVPTSRIFFSRRRGWVQIWSWSYLN